MCVISDHLRHDTKVVHRLQQEVLTHMKQVLSPDVKKMYYFSDGAASQYKNFTNFCNLVFHEEDFGISEEWHFLQLVMAKMLVMVWVA